MIPNNNLSVLPFYTSLEQQNARKWWTYGRVYPLFCPAGFLLPFQIIVPHNSWSISNLRPVQIIDANTNQSVADITNIVRTMIYKKEFATLGYDVWVFPGQLPVINALPNGRYYLMMVWGYALYSEIFTVVNDIQPYLKITWWDVDDFVMDAGTIVYKNPAFKNVLYLQSDLAKPEYPFEEEGETRDGYFFPTKQISEKRYRFNFLASEYLLDVMRFIRMADFAEIEYHGQRYSLDTFLITPEWESEGDVATVEAVFETATVAKKIGSGYIKALRGDFNDDFNNDYDNNGGGSGPTPQIQLVKSQLGVFYMDYNGTSAIRQLQTTSASVNSYKLVCVNVDGFVGRTIRITSANPRSVDGAKYACFTASISPFTFSEISSLGPVSGSMQTTSITPIESFNISSQDNVKASVTKTIPANSKYLLFTASFVGNLSENDISVELV